MSQHRPAGNVKGFFDKFDRLMEAETFFLAHKSYIDADNVLRQIVCSSSSFKQAFFLALLHDVHTKHNRKT